MTSETFGQNSSNRNISCVMGLSPFGSVEGSISTFSLASIGGNLSFSDSHSSYCLSPSIMRLSVALFILCGTLTFAGKNLKLPVFLVHAEHLKKVWERYLGKAPLYELPLP